MACREGHLPVAAFLLQHHSGSAGPQAEFVEDGFVAACKSGHVDIATMLVNLNVLLLDQLNQDGMGAFTGACAENYADIVALLLQHPDFDGTQLSSGLCMAQDMHIVEMILRHPKVNVNAVGVVREIHAHEKGRVTWIGQAGITPLAYACTDGSTAKVVRFLQIPDLDVNFVLEVRRDRQGPSRLLS
ncbi:hypothetical protein DYB32_004296 [Aphanomyces invadans]|uniref:Uncharacterized protein n=1 Tax=Aphanomyces invadans TaxID=157072 RepID=A0A418AXX7_9STRA|nr:hypothetical protein DYB32_004296 [Aphanomyces invadans]